MQDNNWFQQRSKQIGAVVLHARMQQKRTVTECAAMIGTSRRRYAAMERGDVAFSFVELERLICYLGIEPGHISPQIVLAERRSVTIEEQPDAIVVRISK
jgi:transcriptional regulator with XRE-family HTH domain